MDTTTANANSWNKIRNVLCLLSLHTCLIKKCFIYLGANVVYIVQELKQNLLKS